jgi:small-conductance mechanosensitive channel
MDFLHAYEEKIIFIGFIALSVVLVLFMNKVLIKVGTVIVKKVSKQKKYRLIDKVFSYIRKPLRLLLLYFVLLVIIKYFSYNMLSDTFLVYFKNISITLIIAYLLIKLTSVLEEVILFNFRIDGLNNLAARKVHTQFRVLKRIMIFIIMLVALGLVLLNFESIKKIGSTLLTSAGIAGIILGFASQKTISILFAGIQIALTQPIRIDDVVVVENEWGRIEEITLTYVVVKIWDLRRLVLPTTYFIEKPFQNWTRVSSDIIGSVYLYVDFTVDIDDIRKKLDEIVKGTEYWDENVCALQVTNITEQSMELRALVSAKDSGAAWDLRCLVREKLIKYLQETYPHALSKLRNEVTVVNKDARNS